MLLKINHAAAVEDAIPALSVIEIDEKYKNLAEYLLAMFLLLKMKKHCKTAMVHVVLEKTWKICKRKIFAYRWKCWFV